MKLGAETKTVELYAVPPVELAVSFHEIEVLR